MVEALPSRDSAALAELARADALVVRAPGAPALPAGAMCDFLPIA